MSFRLYNNLAGKTLNSGHDMITLSISIFKTK
jgi:hypothetical protein